MKDDLTETEKEHILKQLDALKEQFDFPSEGLADLVNNSSSKLIECQHEIIITVIGKVYEENDEGETVSAKEICQKNYHIPVPPLQDYNEYLSGFFTHLENCIIQSADQATKNNEDDNNG